MKQVPHPFIKWAGGKSRLVDFIIAKLPLHINTYYEPMVGGGAVLFELWKRNQFKKALISDANQELITTYIVIKNQVQELIKELKKNKYTYDKTQYYKIRALKTAKLDDIKIAARFIYLNKSCFNGLYRVNTKGEFNVPFGRYINPRILDAKNLLKVNEVLQKVEIVHDDFSIAESADSADAVYFDPPYLPISKTANFDKYTDCGFGLVEHERLANLFNEISKKTTVVLSNSNSELAISLYRKFNIEYCNGRRTIGGHSRFQTQEIIVSNA